MILALLIVAASPFNYPGQPAFVPAPATAPFDPALEAMSAAELAEMGRAQLEEGDVQGAASSYATAYRKNPRLPGLKKAWARALLKLSDQRRKLGDVAGERAYFVQAGEVDSTLADDPEYVQGFKAVNLPMGGSDGKAFSELKMPRRPSREKKYLGLHLGADAVTPVGLGLSALILEHAELRVTFDTIFLGMAVGARAIFLKSNWSPYAGIGGRFSFRPQEDGFIYATHAFFLDIGVQYAHPSGFFLDIGLAWMPPRMRASQVDDLFFPLPKVAVGWNFGW